MKRTLALLAALAGCGPAEPTAQLRLALAQGLADQITFLQIAFVPNPNRTIPCEQVMRSCLVKQMDQKTVEPVTLAGDFKDRPVARVTFTGVGTQTVRVELAPGRYLVFVEGVKLDPQATPQKGELVANGCEPFAEVKEGASPIAVTLAAATDAACDALVP